MKARTVVLKTFTLQINGGIRINWLASSWNYVHLLTSAIYPSVNILYVHAHPLPLTAPSLSITLFWTPNPTNQQAPGAHTHCLDLWR